jgi:hypothetical protein
MPGLCVLIHKYTKRAPKEFMINVNWFRYDDKTFKWLDMNIDQDMIVNHDTFNKEWKELDL